MYLHSYYGHACTQSNLPVKIYVPCEPVSPFSPLSPLSPSVPLNPLSPMSPFIPVCVCVCVQSLKNIFTGKPIIGLRRNPNLRQNLNSNPALYQIITPPLTLTLILTLTPPLTLTLTLAPPLTLTPTLTPPSLVPRPYAFVACSTKFTQRAWAHSSHGVGHSLRHGHFTENQ